jgi:muramoyltetrapeptide carboxypeptidase
MSSPLKPPGLRPGDTIRVLSLSSPVEEARLQKGCEEITKLGFQTAVDRDTVLAREGFFAGSIARRTKCLESAFADGSTRAIMCSRGGYGSNYLLEGFQPGVSYPKLFMGYSDLTSLQIFLWQKYRWVTHYGPMVASGFDNGPGVDGGYDRDSFLMAATDSRKAWKIPLRGESISSGVVEGTILGGCLTMVETSLGTPWELDTRGAILVLEDRGMKPWQVDRALMHLQQAGKFRGVAGIILGEFPECDPPAGSESVKDVARRILGRLELPIVWGAPVGHAIRPMLTLPLGVWARLSTDGGTDLDILEPAVI